MKELTDLLNGRAGHFKLESGFHGEWWFELDALLKRRDELQPFVRALAQRLATHQVDGVCGPMTGGAELAQRVATELAVPCYFAERFAATGETGLFPVRYTIPAEQRTGLRGRRIALVDDAISAGSAVRGTYADLVACGACPVVLGALFAFGVKATEFAAECSMACEVIATMPHTVWRPEECPLCRAGESLEDLLAAT